MPATTCVVPEDTSGSRFLRWFAASPRTASRLVPFSSNIASIISSALFFFVSVIFLPVHSCDPNTNILTGSDPDILGEGGRQLERSHRSAAWHRRHLPPQVHQHPSGTRVQFRDLLSFDDVAPGVGSAGGIFCNRNTRCDHFVQNSAERPAYSS